MESSTRVAPLWAIQIIKHPSGVVGRGAQVRVRPDTVKKLRSGQMSPAALWGSEQSPGYIRAALGNILPSICLSPECEVSFVLQEATGAPFTPIASFADARAAAEAAFSKGEANGHEN